MNLWSVTALGIGSMVGAGIFALLGQTALAAGRYTYVAFTLGGVVAMLSGYSYARLAARYPDAGGLVTYFDHAFGVGRISGALSLMYLITMASAMALLAKAFGAYATALVGWGTNQILIDISASGIFTLLLMLNLAGAALVGRAEIVLVAIKLVILTGLMIAGAIGMIGKTPVAHVEPHLMAVISSVGLTFLAYSGYGIMANAAGNVARPERTIPRAIFLAIGVVIVLYVGLALVVLGSASSAELAQHTNTVVAEAARPIFGSFGYVAVSVGALLATASGINAFVFSAMQISLALADAKQLPKIFSRRIWGDGTRGLIFGAAGILLVINLFDLSAIANIASAAFLIVYMAIHVAHWRLIVETKGSRLLVALGFLSMAVVLACFISSIVYTQPWSVGLIVVFVAGSWMVEIFLARSNAALQPPAHV